jgi:chaperone modulatory protein CbpM
MNQKILNGILLDEQTELTLVDLCSACSSSEEWIVELVEEGALEPFNLQNNGKQYTQWLFSADSLQKARTAKRLQRDLNINLAGIALALNLLEQIETLEARLRCLEITTK